MEVPKDNKLDIEINPDVAEGVYSNLAVISHSSTEFVVDFLQMLPGLQKPMVRTRAILTPFHAKRLLNALADNVEKYESVFGRIPDNINEQNEKYDTITPLAKA